MTSASLGLADALRPAMIESWAIVAAVVLVALAVALVRAGRGRAARLVPGPRAALPGAGGARARERAEAWLVAEQLAVLSRSAGVTPPGRPAAGASPTGPARLQPSWAVVSRLSAAPVEFFTTRIDAERALQEVAVQAPALRARLVLVDSSSSDSLDAALAELQAGEAEGSLGPA